MKRHRARNPARFTRRQYAVAATVGGIGALGVYWYLRRSRSSGGVKVFPATLTLPSPGPQQGVNQAPELDKTRSYAATVVVKVSKFGDTYDVVLHHVDPGDEFDIEVELLVTHNLENNKFYGVPHHQFCLGTVLRGRVQVDEHQAKITNATIEPAPLLCPDSELSIPWPSSLSEYGNLVPVPSLDFDGHDLVISIEAPALTYGTEVVEPGKGYSVDWWKNHTQPDGYDMTVILAVTETKV